MDWIKYKKNNREEDAIRAFEASLSESQLPINGYMILKDNCLVEEKYYGGYEEKSLHRMYSAAKSFASLGIGCLADEGKLKLDDKIIDYFPEYVKEDKIDDNLKALTIRDMLMMSTCYPGPTYKASADWAESFFIADNRHTPGMVFSYDTSSAFVAGALIEKLTGMKVLDYLRKVALDEIGFSKEAYIMEACGHSDCGSGLMCTLRDLAVVISLCGLNGKYNGKQLLPEEYLEEAFKNQIPTSLCDSVDERFGYGYMFWKTRHDGFCMYGIGGQLAAHFKEAGLTFVIMSDTRENVAGIQLIWRAFYDHIYPAFSRQLLDEKTDGCMRPTIGNLHNQLDDFVNKRRFVCDDNWSEVKEFELDLDGGILILFEKERTVEVPFGRNEWKHHIYMDTKSVSSGNWIGDFTFGIRTYMMDEIPGHIFYEIAFKGNEALLHMRASSDPRVNKYKNNYIRGMVK